MKLIKALFVRLAQCFCLHDAREVKPTHRWTFSTGDEPPRAIHTEIDCTKCKLRWWHIARLERNCLVCGEPTTRNDELCKWCADI